MKPPHLVVSRRQVVAGTGALVLSFCSSSRLPAQQQEGLSPARPAVAPAQLPGSLKNAPFLDSWIRIPADGTIAVCTGKAELGQGIRTALIQVAAEELDVPLSSVVLVTADTARTPNEGYTSGSQSMQESGIAIRNAAAQVRALLMAEAGRKLSLPIDVLRTENGTVIGNDGRRLRYGEIVSTQMLHVEAQAQSALKEPAALTVIGTSAERVDIPAKVTGGTAYVHDLRLPDMLHARVVRPPSYTARLAALDAAEVEGMPGVVKVVRDGNFVAVVSEREFQAVKAMRVLAAAARWEEKPGLPKQRDVSSILGTLAAQEKTIHDARALVTVAHKSLAASYTRPYQAHASIGPSCAVAEFADDSVTVWSHTQGVYPDRQAIAEMLGLPLAQVRCIHMEGSGCYGHNGADDAAADAALIARAVPGRPIRLQWTREQEHGWEPYGPAMVTKVTAALDAGGSIVDWDYGVWSNTHSMRPGGAGALIAARSLALPFAEPEPKPIPQPPGGGDRNAIPPYRLPNARVVHHFIPSMPLRVSALRALGAYMNVFSIESFMDELAQAAGSDPVEFRLKHLGDERARAAVSSAAERFGWSRTERLPRGRGRGFGFARYKNLAAYCAVAMEVEVARETGRVRVIRAVAAVDSGQVVNPNGLTNQIEGGIIQSLSWTLYEQVTFDDTRITSIDWATYPILRFNAVPESLEVHILNRPGAPFLGSGEAAQGPAGAALANAVANATGHRFRDLPLTRARIRAAAPA